MMIESGVTARDFLRILVASSKEWFSERGNFTNSKPHAQEMGLK
jgi:hypothetical protein